MELGLWFGIASIISFLVQIVESDKTHFVDCTSSNQEMEKQKLDETGMINRSEDKESGDCHALISGERIGVQPYFFCVLEFGLIPFILFSQIHVAIQWPCIIYRSDILL